MTIPQLVDAYLGRTTTSAHLLDDSILSQVDDARDVLRTLLALQPLTATIPEGLPSLLSDGSFAGLTLREQISALERDIDDLVAFRDAVQPLQLGLDAWPEADVRQCMSKLNGAVNGRLVSTMALLRTQMSDAESRKGKLVASGYGDGELARGYEQRVNELVREFEQVGMLLRIMERVVKVVEDMTQRLGENRGRVGVLVEDVGARLFVILNRAIVVGQEVAVEIKREQMGEGSLARRLEMAKSIDHLEKKIVKWRQMLERMGKVRTSSGGSSNGPDGVGTNGEPEQSWVSSSMATSLFAGLDIDASYVSVGHGEGESVGTTDSGKVLGEREGIVDGGRRLLQNSSVLESSPKSGTSVRIPPSPTGSVHSLSDGTSGSLSASVISDASLVEKNS